MFLFYIHLYFWQRSKYFRPDHRLAYSGQCSPLSSSAFLEGQQAWHLTWSQANCLCISAVGNYAQRWKKLETTGCVWFGQLTRMRGSLAQVLPEWCLKILLLGLPSQSTYLTLTGVQIHKPNIFALAFLEYYHSIPHQEYEVWKNKEAIEHPKPGH